MLGAGVIALEMGQFYARMGSRVTSVGRSSRVAGREDPDVGDALRRALEADGVAFVMDAEVERLEGSPEGVTAVLAGGGSPVRGSHLFVAIGREPNTRDLGLETIGLALGPDALIPVDERLATTVPGVWAAGDIRGGPQFTHTSWDDHRILLSQLAGDGGRTTRRIVPYGIFTDPELGRVGLGEEDAGGRAAPRGAALRLARNGGPRDGDRGLHQGGARSGTRRSSGRRCWRRRAPSGSTSTSTS